MAGMITGQPANPYSRSTSPSGYAERDQYSQRARDAGYEWDPVQSKWVRGPAHAGGRFSAFVNAAMSGLQSATGRGGGSTGGGSTRIDRVPSVEPMDTSAADAATFARAKDIAGQTGRASLESLRGLLGEAGQLGSGAEIGATQNIVERAAGHVGDVSREQAIQKSERDYQRVHANQQSALTQRGQDINAQEAEAQRELMRTHLQFQQAEAQARRQLELLKMALSSSQGWY